MPFVNNACKKQRAGIISDNDITESSKKLLGSKFAKRIDTIVIDVIETTLKKDLEFINASQAVYTEILKLRKFLFEKVYFRSDRQIEKDKIREILFVIHAGVSRDPQANINPYPGEDPVTVRIIDFIAGMTDNYVLNLSTKLIARA